MPEEDTDYSAAFKSARGKIRQQSRDLRDRLLSNLDAQTDTRKRRSIKEFAEEARNKAIKDLETEYKVNPNKSDYESDISQRGFDGFNPPEATEADEIGGGGGGGGQIPDGFTTREITICESGSAVQITVLVES